MSADHVTHRIYLDNAATSWPKPDSVYVAVEQYQRQLGVAAGRGAYRDAISVGRAIDQTRAMIARLIGAPHPQFVTFAFSGTDALNTALHGLLGPGDHVVASVVEHNSVLRPLAELTRRQQIEVTWVASNADGTVAAADYEQVIRDNTRMLIVTHASNVTGAIQPLDEIAQIARQHAALLLVDAAQTAGHLPIDVAGTPIDVWTASGHKGLLGPLGTGILWLSERAAGEIQSFRQGGTGTSSESDRQPAEFPEMLESGNLNVPGIVGLRAGVEFLLNHSIEQSREHEIELTEQLLDGLGRCPGVTLHGPRSADRRVGVVSFSIENCDPHEATTMLDMSAGIQCRAGLHCAPKMHQTLRTLEMGGTVRLSLGIFNTDKDMEIAVAAVRELSAAMQS